MYLLSYWFFCMWSYMSVLAKLFQLCSTQEKQWKRGITPKVLMPELSMILPLITLWVQYKVWQKTDGQNEIDNKDVIPKWLCQPVSWQKAQKDCSSYFSHRKWQNIIHYIPSFLFITIHITLLSHNLRSGSAITLCRKSHIALVQYLFLFSRFPVITLLQTGRKWCHLW